MFIQPFCPAGENGIPIYKNPKWPWEPRSLSWRSPREPKSYNDNTLWRRSRVPRSCHGSTPCRRPREPRSCHGGGQGSYNRGGQGIQGAVLEEVEGAKELPWQHALDSHLQGSQNSSTPDRRPREPRCYHSSTPWRTPRSYHESTPWRGPRELPWRRPREPRSCQCSMP